MLASHSIDLSTFTDVLSRYPAQILSISDSQQKRKSAAAEAEDTLASLDSWRIETLPGTLKTRREAEKDGDYLQKGEVERLIRWKLKHGTFRPSLMKLDESNDEDLIREVTARAFSALGTVSDTEHKLLFKSVMKGISILTELRGIGPASASLLLAVRFPKHVPFFSDEAYRWLTHTTGDAWTSSIKYNVKEYGAMLTSSLALSKRLGVDAMDIERVGWVLGQEKAELEHPIVQEPSTSKRKKDQAGVEQSTPDGDNRRLSKRSKR